MSTPLLDVEGLSVAFRGDQGTHRAVDNISFSIERGKTVALVGESGCGKSVSALSLARLLPEPPAVYEGGRIGFDGSNILEMDEGGLRQVRGGRIGYIFQEPAGSLNPVIRIGAQIVEAIRLHRPGIDARKEALSLLATVGIPDPERRFTAWPHELSGGMQQRVMIATALACQPDLLVADEPTTALDVTIQAQILELLQDLQKQFGMAILLITHNLGLVADIAHELHVMYAGRIVESGPAVEVLRHPVHPYTLGLLAAVPRLSGSADRLEGIGGFVPPIHEMPSGCRFHPRCPKSEARCASEAPEESIVEGEHRVRCHFWK